MPRAMFDLSSLFMSLWSETLSMLLQATDPSLPSGPSVTLSVASDPSSTLGAYGAMLAVALTTVWALLERSERRSCQRQSEKLSLSFQTVTEQHYRERLQAEERHLMTHDSSMRNVLESLERSLLGKPRL